MAIPQCSLSRQSRRCHRGRDRHPRYVAYAGRTAFAAAMALATASFAAVAAAKPTRPHVSMHRARPPIVVTVHPSPDPRGGWGGPEWYTKGWGGKGWGYGRGQGLLAGALIGGGLTAPYYDFTYGYPPNHRPWGYPYVAFPYGIGYPYYNISYGYYRPPTQ